MTVHSPGSNLHTDSQTGPHSSQDSQSPALPAPPPPLSPPHRVTTGGAAPDGSTATAALSLPSAQAPCQHLFTAVVASTNPNPGSPYPMVATTPLPPATYDLGHLVQRALAFRDRFRRYLPEVVPPFSTSLSAFHSPSATSTAAGVHGMPGVDPTKIMAESTLSDGTLLRAMGSGVVRGRFSDRTVVVLEPRNITGGPPSGWAKPVCLPPCLPACPNDMTLAHALAQNGGVRCAWSGCGVLLPSLQSSYSSGRVLVPLYGDSRRPLAPHAMHGLQALSKHFARPAPTSVRHHEFKNAWTTVNGCEGSRKGAVST